MNTVLPFGRLDPVTGLPSRRKFFEDYDPGPDEETVMLTLSSANHLNQILRALGHEYSEVFLREGAQRLRDVLPGEVAIYHVSVLSFAFIQPHGANLHLLETIRTAFIRPLLCEDVPVLADIALGLAPCVPDSPSATLRSALAAAQDARDHALLWARYDPGTDTAYQRGFRLLSALPNALESTNQLSLHYQPKYNLATGRPTGAEALLRWMHPELGSISPGEFVPLVEATAHIQELTEWVLKAAIAQIREWLTLGWKLTMAVNVSPQNLMRRDFAPSLLALLEQAGVPPSVLELEVTESVAVKQDQAVRENLRQLRDCGIRLALDDFGTGFANFSYITRLPADILKIDRSFVDVIATDARTALVVHSLIELAHRLDYRVVAEGIETEAAYRLLAEWGCDEGQGYFMRKPLDAAQFTRLMLAQGIET